MDPQKTSSRSTGRPHCKSPAKSRSTPPLESKRRRSPSDNNIHSKSFSRIPKPPAAGGKPPYGSSYSWDSAQGQAFLDRVTATPFRIPSSSSLTRMESEAPQSNRDTPYMALVQLFNQFQGMPIDTKRMLVTVTVLGSVGPLRVVITSDATVKDLIQIALLKYLHEGRVPALGRRGKDFQVYSSQFSTQALNYDDKITDLGTRNFVLCPVKQIQGSCASSSSTLKSWWSYVTGVTGIKSLV